MFQLRVIQKINLSIEAEFGDYEVLYQKWFWDGISAESLIFIADDVGDMGDDALKAFVAESPLVDDNSKFTIARDRKGYTFVNFNFELP